MKDRHWRTPYRLGDITFFGTSLDSPQRRENRAGAPRADIGLYLDDRWHGESDAHESWFVDWPTLAEPPRAREVLRRVAYLIDAARGGAFVEIACFGGHGRTGTVMACADVMLGATPQQAVARTRTEYCPYTIGSAELRDFVDRVPGLLTPAAIEQAPR